MAIESLHELCKAMDTVAVETWRRLEVSRLPGHRFDETSVTDSILYMLRDQVPGLLIYQTNQVIERRTGADWEWWIGDDRAGWICLRIQAKRAYENNTYKMLGHPGGEEDSFQYDTLINGCNPDQARYAFHVFYNGWPEGTFAPGTRWAVPAEWNACPAMRGYDECKHAEVRHYGCAIISSHDVKALSDNDSKYSVVKYLSNAVPWSYAFGFPPIDFSDWHREERWHPQLDRGDWVDRIHGTLEVVARRGGVRGARDASGHLGEVPINRNQRTFELPTYVQAMRRTTSGLFEPASEDEVPAAPQTVIVERKPKRARKK
ncbi:DUF6615 family protein [Streptomyces alkaliphilus]|uniref:DUF6615 family protein n=1 Tax=Streptomyces alkaliphilus TaxID=1472722 RepID=UPI00117E796B|nr:hypothetical protein [Streptomyces alkaliphilus]